MKKVLNMAVALALIFGVSSSAYAQSVPAATPSIAAQASAQIAAQGAPSEMIGGGSPSGRALVWTGGALFIGGMGTAIYGFLNNKNGEFPQFGEATATDKKLGGAGLGIAFAGGALMALGHRMSRMAPDVQAGPGHFKVSKRVSW